MKKFEYADFGTGINPITQRQMFEIGQQGWEMCGVAHVYDQYLYYFKRELPEETKDN